eukprot:TRINITY_DN1844_c1_g2_i2.p1 TRINITY_DN1844_c1_g2~~TRINITY_DN1844_c1_g2_i2.p1  ORF type:complete len:646 (+),score=141.29 TRINITY_DN1844_c1_g2_i2:119-1939(+)
MAMSPCRAFGMAPAHSRMGSPVRTASPRRTPPSAVFRSRTPRFRPGDTMTMSGAIVVGCEPAPSTSPRSADAAPKQTQRPYTSSPARPHSAHGSRAPSLPSPRHSHTTVTAVRKRYARPTRAALEEWSENDRCVGTAHSDVACICAAGSTVWCAEASGEITVREKDGGVVGSIDRGPGAAAVTALVHAGGTCGSGKVVVADTAGEVSLLDASLGVMCDGARLHTGPIRSAALLHDSGSGSLLLTCGADGCLCVTDLTTLDKVCRLARQDSACECTCAAGAGFRCFGGYEDGAVIHWDVPLQRELDRVSLPGGVRDMLVGGRYLWCAVSASPSVRVVDVASLCEVLAVCEDAQVSKLVRVGGCVWTAADDGSLTSWDAQTVAAVRSVKVSGSVKALAAVVAVQQDCEVWTCGSGSIQMWRDGAYTLPVWCCEALSARERTIEESREEVRRLRHELDRRALQSEQDMKGMRDELVAHNELARGVQGLAEASKQELSEERGRRRRLEVEVSQLRRAVIQACYPTESAAAHHPVSALCAAVARLADERSPALTAAGSPDGDSVQCAVVQQRCDELQRENSDLRSKLLKLSRETALVEELVRAQASEVESG